MNYSETFHILKFKKLHPSATLPQYKTEGSAGMDVTIVDDLLEILPNQTKIANTGLAAEIHKGFEIQIRPRSGLALKGLILPNSPGTIDSDYRGEIKIILHNIGKEPFEFHCGDRIAQLVLCRIEQAEIYFSDELEETNRGSNGFGSTGIK